MAQVVREAINACGITPNATATHTGIPHTTLKRRLQTGDFTVAELTSIAHMLGTKPSALLRKAEQAGPLA